MILLLDTLALTYVSSRRTTGVRVPLLNTGIAWTTDKQQRFHNPSGQYNRTACMHERHATLQYFQAT